MFDNIEMLNRLTLNSDESVDHELFYTLLKNHNLTSIFRNIARDILKIKINQICKSESSKDILFVIKFDNDDSAISAKRLIDNKIYKFSDQSFKVSVKHNSNKLKILFIDVDIVKEGDEI